MWAASREEGILAVSVVSVPGCRYGFAELVLSRLEYPPVALQVDTCLCRIPMFWEAVVCPPGLAAMPYGLQQLHSQVCGDRGLLDIICSP